MADRRHDIASAGQALQDGATTAERLARCYMDRIAAHAGLGAYAEVTADHAMAAARRMDAEITAGRWRGPLHGIPVAVKDLIDTDFACTRIGMPRFHDRRPPANAVIVERLEAAGAVILGKLTMTEGAYMAHSPMFPLPRNPWSAEHWTGVSSSGSGVAVAADLCLGALASDTGGSIRLPSAACGVTGLKPTYGLVSTEGVFPLAAELDHVGPMARSAADAAALLDGMVGGGQGRYLSALTGDRGGLRIGVDEAVIADRVAPPVGAAMREALAQFEELGAVPVPVKLPPSAQALRAFAVLVAGGAAEAHADAFPGHEKEYGAELAALIRQGMSVTDGELHAAEHARRNWRNRLESVLAQVDMLVVPALPIEVPTLAALGELAMDPEIGIADHTIPFNLTGNPTITFPIGFDASGLPIAMQLVAGHHDEGRLLRMAHDYQSVTRWHLQRPPAV